ncbi:MAG TPA: histone deacetylase [Methylomusa anaerophila]|uniref:Histone deacetylase-like amidohydrolase n=1 Tax=Methylomusa anaerophila TaxID=1930071 RepID=A0A348AFZ9_9FIRM|nr:histone deacetylase [Methylomusa anaerophila]BBB89997.1 histone deacetylase-like amidohydrolase [Methylomusa anaerophila]HML88274.1 histone deacetylase [Methylomusa anaerophila]
MKTNSLGLVFFPAFDWAISPTHPEREERLLYTRDQIVEEGLLDIPAIREYKPRMADIQDAERVHIGVPDIASLITDAHLVSAGGAITAAEAVMRREIKRAFALVRPPGHHSMRVVHGTRGFCTINTEAIMIEYLRQHYGIRKIAIVDTDVHHGDGTQDIFYHDPDTLFISFHQDGRTLYPGTGAVEELGSPGALASTVNIPLPPGTTDQGLHYVLDNLILPMLEDYQPEIIINSAGQDNHYSDPLANMAVTAQGYAKLAEKLKADIAVLEGGYSIEDALPYVNVGIILAMAGQDYSKVIEPDIARCPRQSDSTTAYIEQLVSRWRGIWNEREQLKREAVAKAGGVWRRKRRVYYDDSGIDEHQTEVARLCPKCQGYLTVATEAAGHPFGHKSAFAAVIFRNSCPECRREARDAVVRARKEGEYQHYYIQDKSEDRLEKLK